MGLGQAVVESPPIMAPAAATLAATPKMRTSPALKP